MATKRCPRCKVRFKTGYIAVRLQLMAGQRHYNFLVLHEESTEKAIYENNPENIIGDRFMCSEQCWNIELGIYGPLLRSNQSEAK